jgi:hypothetical protein
MVVDEEAKVKESEEGAAQAQPDDEKMQDETIQNNSTP